MRKFITVALCATGLSFLSTGVAHGASTAQAGEWHSDVSEQKCIADNIYWEARNQPLKGMIAVALVSRNRVNDERFPHSYCEVIHQGPTRPSWKDNDIRIPVRNRCHFSWYCDGKSDDIPEYDLDVYSLARAIAFKIYWGEFDDFTVGATHYHADYVTPEWANTKTPTLQVEDHIFYRWEK
jgi:spore germination cell wall hydrolase CwlJ-like protein